MFRSSETPSGQPLLYSAVPPNDTERGRSPILTTDSDAHSRPITPRLATASSKPTPTNTPPPSAGPTARPPMSRRSTFRSRSPHSNAAMAARRKYTYAAICLLVSLVSFTIQTELAAYVATDLEWDHPYCMMYFTHGSWALLWPLQLLVLRIQKRDQPWHSFWRRHVFILRTTAQMVEHRTLDVPAHSRHSSKSPWIHVARTTVLVTTALTIAGLGWYVAVNKTTPSDLTAIYNCSAFFAYAFSVPILRERVRLDKSLAVLVAIMGVLVVAYGDTKSSGSSREEDARLETRFVGNMIIGAGSVLYGLYEVLYKRLACPPDGVSPSRGMTFANFFGSCIGLFTLLVLWIPLPVLHILGWEPFSLPTGRTAWLLAGSAVMNATFAGSFLVLISLTSPVLSSVAALLTIFIVAVVDWFKTGEPLSGAAVVGGALIVAAFAVLSWSTWREMQWESEKAEREDVDGGLSGSESEEED